MLNAPEQSDYGACPISVAVLNGIRQRMSPPPDPSNYPSLFFCSTLLVFLLSLILLAQICPPFSPPVSSMCRSQGTNPLPHFPSLTSTLFLPFFLPSVFIHFWVSSLLFVFIRIYHTLKRNGPFFPSLFVRLG